MMKKWYGIYPIPFFHMIPFSKPFCGNRFLFLPSKAKAVYCRKDSPYRCPGNIGTYAYAISYASVIYIQQMNVCGCLRIGTTLKGVFFVIQDFHLFSNYFLKPPFYRVNRTVAHCFKAFLRSVIRIHYKYAGIKFGSCFIAQIVYTQFFETNRLFAL